MLSLNLKILSVFLVIAISFLYVNQAKAFFFAFLGSILGAIGTVATVVFGTTIGLMITTVFVLDYFICTFNIIWGGCSGGDGGGGEGGGDGGEGQSIAETPAITTTCDSVSLTYDISNAKQYGIYRDDNPIINGSAEGLSQINYTDSNLAPRTNYRYILVLANDKNENFQFPEITAYTKCLPKCTFGADKEQVVFPATVNLSWICQYADSCEISPGVGAVSATQGTTEVTPLEDTNYILTCQNGDGSASFPASIKVTGNPKYKEVPPY